MKDILDSGYPAYPGTMLGERCWTYSRYGFCLTWMWDGTGWIGAAISAGTVNPNPIYYDDQGNPHRADEPIEYHDPYHMSCDSAYYRNTAHQHTKWTKDGN